VSWAKVYIERLRAGERVAFRPTGASMSGRIESGQLCTVIPVDPARLVTGEVVLCTVGIHDYLHIVHAIEHGRFLIGNNHGFMNGWVGPADIHGKCVGVE
jgi:hypothetical protein